MPRKVLIGIGIVVGVLIIIALLLPVFVDANKFKPTLESDISSALGRKVEIGNISLSIFSGGVTVDNISISDDPNFSSSPFLTAKELTVGVSLFPLIFSKRLEVKSFTISEPQVTLLRASDGKWNYSSLGTGGTKAPAKPGTPSSPDAVQTNFSVEKLRLSNGTITVGRSGREEGAANVRHYDNVDLEASDLSYTTQFPFTLTMKTPGGGSVKLDGKAGPINAEDASLTPMNATATVENLDLAATGLIDPSTGLGGIIDFNGQVNSDGHELTSKGTLKANKVKAKPQASPATVPVNVDYGTAYDLKRQTGSVTQGDVHIGKALAVITGTYDASGAVTSLQMRFSGKTMPVPDLEGLLPAVGVVLPSGASLQSGTLDVTLKIEGPVDKLVITGPINLSNAKLAGYNLKDKLGALSEFAGIGGGSGSDTEIQTLSANLRDDPTGTHLSDLNLVVPSMGSITGDANISPSGELNCKMAAKLGNSGSAMGAASGALTSLTGGGGGGGGGIPFTITGTTSNPVLKPDLGGMAKGAVGTPKNAANTATGVLGGLLKKKKN